MVELSKSKKIFFSFLALLLAWGIVELTIYLAYGVVMGKQFPADEYKRARERAAAFTEGKLKDSGAPAEKKPVEVIHPYFGFVLDPQRTSEVSPLGFPGNDDPFARAPGVINIAVFGGSFAEGLSREGEEALVEVLGRKGFEAQVLTVAMGGYKQPQQLNILTYLLSHGAAIDVVVNLDGFNEVALPGAENLPRGISPFFPRNWYQRTLEVEDRATLRHIGQALVLNEKRRNWASLFQSVPRWSAVGNILWRSYDRSLEHRVLQHREEIRAPIDPRQPTFRAAGPKLGRTEGPELYERIAQHWAATSRMMADLCASRGIPYLHILQPNQYVEGSKILTPEERTRAFRADHPYRVGVTEGYPRLLRASSELKEEGVDFHDFTRIYINVEGTIYRDDCCHPNRRGYEIVAHRIGKLLAERLPRAQ